jgi:hypothetical protein
MSEEYDPYIDAFRSWLLAITELRKQGLREGRFLPENEEEEQYMKEHANG